MTMIKRLIKPVRQLVRHNKNDVRYYQDFISRAIERWRPRLTLTDFFKNLNSCVNATTIIALVYKLQFAITVPLFLRKRTVTLY